jgi:TRAP-type C4-dicarboxylate transport system substrate-binding protein
VQEAVDQMQTYGVTVSHLDDKQRFIRKAVDVHVSFLQKNPSVPMDLYDRIKRTAE